MPVVELNQWAPDMWPGSSGLAPRAENVIPNGRGYWSVPQPTRISPTDSAIDGLPNALYHDVAVGRSAYTFLGTGKKLYRLGQSGATSITRLSGDYTEDGSSKWRRVTYNDQIYFFNGIDECQKFVMDGSANCVDQELWNDGTTGKFLTGKYCAHIAGFNVIANCLFDTSKEKLPYRVWWSGLGFPDNYFPDATTQADWRDIVDLGEVRGITGGDYGLILMERGVVRMDYVGPPTFFRFQTIKVGDGTGCDIPESVFKYKGMTIYHSRHGWMACDGQTVNALGDDRIDRWFNDTMLAGTDALMSVASMPDLHCLMWLFASADAQAYPSGHPYVGTQIPDTGLVYSEEENKWSTVKVTAQVVGNIVNPTSWTLEDLDASYDTIDTDPNDPTKPYPGKTSVVPASFDSQLWIGDSEPVPSVWQMVDGSTTNEGGAATFTGPSLPAVIDTPEMQLQPDMRSVIQRVIPMIEGEANTVQVQVISRVKFTPGSETTSQIYLESPDGSFRTRCEGRYHRIRMTTTGNWTRAAGAEVLGAVKGRR